MNILLRNNTGNKPKSVLIDGFVVRVKVFHSIFSDIKVTFDNNTPNSYLIVGQRGSGKTTLLHRLKYEIEDDQSLNGQLIPIVFNEEQYNITELLNFWETIGEYLDDTSDFGTIANEIQELTTGNHGDEIKAYQIIKSALDKENKKVLVFIENIDCFLEKIGNAEQLILKEILANDTIRLIGSTTTYFDGIVGKNSPFFNFFKVYQLNGLNKSESIKLLLKLGEQTNELSQIQNIIRRNPKRIESLRRLTGGNPRTMAYLFQIFLDKGNSKAIGDLYRLLDDLTFLYKAELDALSPQQQKVVDGIARNWDAISVKELATKIKLDGKHISSVLGVLERNQVIETVPTRTKNNLYRLKDRFLNIWYLMRFGRKRDKENIIWLVRFYDAWCDKNELRNRIVNHIADLNSGKYDSVAALDMGNTFLSCENVPSDLKYSLYQTTKSYLPKELISDLKLSEKDLYESIKQLVKKRNFTKAESILAEINIKDAHYYTFYYWIYYNQGNYEKAVEFLTRVFELKKVELADQVSQNKQVGIIAYNVAKLYDTVLSNPELAVKYYKQALTLQVHKAAYRLGQIYYYDLDNLDKSAKFHQIAIDNNVDVSIMALATIYYKETYYEEAEKLCLLAIGKGDNDARNNYSIILQEYEKHEEAITVLNTAIDNGSGYALINLGQLYMNKPNPEKEKAISCFLKAVEEGVHESYFNAGKYFVREKNFAEGEKYLKMGLKLKDAECAHLLAHEYHKKDKWAKAEKLFIDAYNWGKKTALICLLNCAFSSKKHDRKEFILELFNQHLAEIVGLGPIAVILYCQLLVWNDDTDISIKYLLEAGPDITKVLNGYDEEYKEDMVGELTDYFIQLMSKDKFLQVSEMFNQDMLNLKQILKPVHFALMNYMKEEHPNEYLKAGAEIQETVEEIIDEVELLKTTNNI